MSISGIGGAGSSYPPSAAQTTAQKAQQTIQDFLNFAKEPTAQRLQDAWLKSHGLSKDKLAAMTPEQRDTVIKQMAEEIKQQLKQSADNKTTGTKVDLFA